VWTHAKVSVGLSSLLWTSDENGISTGWVSGSQLVESDCLTTVLLDGVSGTGSESQSGDGSLRERVQSQVIGDSTDNDDSLLCGTGLLKSSGNLGNRNWLSVGLGQEQKSQDDLVEWCISTT